MNILRPFLALPARLMLPLLLATFTLPFGYFVYTNEAQNLAQISRDNERQRLIETLSGTQTRLTVQIGFNPMLSRRIVSALALQDNLKHAWLFDEHGEVIAGLNRRDIGSKLADLTREHSLPSEQLKNELVTNTPRGIHLHHLAEQDLLLGHVPIHGAGELIAVVDLALPAQRLIFANRAKMALEIGSLLFMSLLFGVTLHLLWFRRAGLLTRTAREIGKGNLSVRANLEGNDELAKVSRSLDTMASQLQSQNLQLQNLADVMTHSPVVVIVWSNSPGWPAVFVSDNIRQWGYQPETFTSADMQFSSLIHPDDLARVADEVSNYIENGPDEYIQEYRIRDAAGRWFWIEDRTWLTRNTLGEVTSIQGIVLDIEARKRSENALRQTLFELDIVANASPVLFWTSGLDKGCYWFNDAWLKFTGRSMEQELGNGWTEGVHPVDFDDCLATYLNAFDARTPFAMEYRLRRHDDTYRWIVDYGQPRYDADGCFLGFIGSCLDITEQVQAERALRESEERLRFALAAATQGLYDLDLRSGEAQVSPEYATMLGFDPDTFHETHQLWRARLHPDDHAAVFNTFDKYVAGELPEYRVEFRMRTYDGRWKWILSMGKILQWSADGQPVRMLGTHTDIDALKRAEASLRELNTTLEARVAQRTVELRALNHSLDSFVYSVSHDLKAPLRGVEGYSRLLLEDYSDKLGKEGNLFVNNIRSGISQMGKLIDDLLAYSRMERKKMTTRSVDLANLARQLSNDMAFHDGKRLEPPVIDLPDIHLKADIDGLAMVLRNLLENARKFSAQTEHPRIVISGQDNGDGSFTFSVCDNGIGFDMKYHDRIFEIFQRLHRQEDYPGTGVGLALTKKAVERMNGTIRAESTPGEGSCFFVTLPSA